VKDPPRRRFVGRDHSWAERVRVYRTDEALEVAHISSFEVSLRRVFFDEVQLVTLHRARDTRTLALLILVAALCALGLLAARTSGALVQLLLAAPLALAAAWALALAVVPAWVVTTFGKRTRARARFPFRQGRARAVYGDICRCAGEAQARLAAEAGAGAFAPSDAGAPGPMEAGASGPMATEASGSVGAGASSPSDAGASGPTDAGASSPTDAGASSPSDAGASGSVDAGASGSVDAGVSGPAGAAPTS
jgi:hypothetical protein